MRRLLRFLDTLNRGLRWALFLPVGIGVSFAAVGLIKAGFDAYWGNPRVTAGLAEESTLAFFAAMTRTLFPAVISPRPWLVGIIMFSLDFLLRAGPLAYRLFGYEYMRYRAPELLPSAVAYVAAGVAGGLLGLYLVRLVMNSAAKVTSPGP